MADNTLKARFKHAVLGGTITTSSTPKKGEIIFNSTLTNFRVGNGSKAYSSLSDFLSWGNITGKPTTLSGYGITDAYILNGTITLGSGEISPITGINIGSTSYSPDEGVITLPEYPTVHNGSFTIKSKVGNVITNIGGTSADASSNSAITLIQGDNVTFTNDASNNTITISSSNTTYEFDGTYNASTNKAATVSTVTNAIEALDGGTIGTPGAGKTLTALSQSNGNISATFGNISIIKSQISDFPTLGTAAGKNFTSSVTENSTDLVTSGAVWSAIDNLPEPMVFKGSLGTGGTITTLPAASSSNSGYTYKVITAGTYQSKAAKVGDTFISTGTEWELIPSGDEPSGTVTSVGVDSDGTINVSGSPITTSGTITVKLSDNVVNKINDGVTAYGWGDHSQAGYLTANSSLNAAKLTGTIPSGCYTNTWIPWAGATSSAAGTAGYMPAPTSAQRNQFLRGDGEWVSLNNYSLPLAASGTRGGIQIGYTESGSNYAVKLDSEKAYVTVPWTDSSTTKTGHYTPSSETYTPTDVTFSWSNTPIVSGISKDSKGHIVDVDITYISNPNIWNPMIGATSSRDGQAGYVSAPPSDGYNEKFLRADGEWTLPNYPTYDQPVFSDIELSKTAQTYVETSEGVAIATIKLPSSDPYTTSRTPSSHTHGNISNSGTLTDTAAAAAGNDYVVIRDASDNKIQTSTIKGTDVADAISKKHEHSSITLNTIGVTYDGTHTIALPASDPYSSARTPESHSHGNITNDGDITATAPTIANGDQLVINDASASKITNGPTFDGSTTTQALSKKGTWETFVTGSSLTADTIIVGDGNSTISSSTKYITTTAPNSESTDDSVPTSAAVWTAVNGIVAATDAMVYKGTIAGGSTGAYGALTAAANKGWTYKVSTAGKINSVPVEVGDILICNTDNTAAATSSNYNTIKANWDVIQANIDGALFKSTNTFTDSHVLVADGTNGKVKDSGFTIGTSVPSNANFTNTTYVFEGGTNKFTVTPSHGSAQDVTITPSITNNVTGSAAWTAANQIVLTNASSGNVVKESSVSIDTNAPTSSSLDNTVPTSAAVWNAISDKLTWKNNANCSSATPGYLSPAATVGDCYTVSVGGFFDGIAVDTYSMAICIQDTAAATAQNYSNIAKNWCILQGNIKGVYQTISNKVNSWQLTPSNDNYPSEYLVWSTFGNDFENTSVYDELSLKVPTSRTVNNKALSSNITLNASDVNALSTAANQGLTATQKNNAIANLGINAGNGLTYDSSTRQFSRSYGVQTESGTNVTLAIDGTSKQSIRLTSQSLASVTISSVVQTDFEVNIYLKTSTGTTLSLPNDVVVVGSRYLADNTNYVISIRNKYVVIAAEGGYTGDNRFNINTPSDIDGSSFYWIPSSTSMRTYTDVTYVGSGSALNIIPTLADKREHYLLIKNKTENDINITFGNITIVPDSGSSVTANKVVAPSSITIGANNKCVEISIMCYITGNTYAAVITSSEELE